MGWFSQDDDAFDPEVVRKAREERDRNENDRSPSGDQGMRCGTCGRIQSTTAIAGSCCYYCHNTLRR